MAEPFATGYLNGDFLPLREARVSPLDRGFLFGDGVYELIPVYGGRPFQLARHFDRLDRSLAGISMQPAYDRQRWTEVCAELIRRNGGGEMYLYLQVTRGAEFGRNHAPPSGLTPTVFAFAAPLPQIPPEKLEQGVGAVTADDLRWARCDIKSTALLANVLHKQTAVAAGVHETILLRAGMLMEGSSATVHVVLDGEIRTPPPSPSILPGITQDVVAELAARDGIPTRTAPISEAELRGAEEIFLAASTFGTLPVTRLDGRPVGTGLPGPVWQRIHRLFEAARREL